MAPLYTLTAGNGKLDCQPEHEAIRRQIVSALTIEPVLSIFDPDRETKLHTDASAIDYGGVWSHHVRRVKVPLLRVGNSCGRECSETFQAFPAWS
ncbi:unnamed protein product [Euphydryas editha]|uniref:Reverse transcriptase/retrotransposon-derived protein RNase H-like domain-containing protein n=1 Tax=Euphydryas editha TaxID=104508 RepID=A0AAU9TM97_EUPED|nr:unnamed protein product [Euphydryas editha]